MIIGQKFLEIKNYFRSNFFRVVFYFLNKLSGFCGFFGVLFLLTSKLPMLPKTSHSYHKRTEECKAVWVISSSLFLHIVLQRYSCNEN